MHRVLSFQMGGAGTRGFGESNEFVSKRMCFSFIFFIGFLALLGGFLLGRFSTERTAKLREERKRLDQIQSNESGGPQSPGKPEQLLLQEFDQISGDKFRVNKSYILRIPEKSEQYGDYAQRKNVRTTLLSYQLFDEIVDRKSSIVATIYGMREPDRWVVLSVSEDGIEPALELAELFGKLKTNRNWKPRRTIVFQFFNESRCSCWNGISKYLKSRIIACLAVHGKAIQKNGCLAASGSDVVTSSVLEAVATLRKSIIADNHEDQRVFKLCKDSEEKETLLINGPGRLPVDVPHASVTFLSTEGHLESIEAETESKLYSRTLTKIIGLTMWRFSENQILHWDPKYLEENVKKALKMITSPQLEEVKENITTTVKELIVEARRSLGDRDENEMEKSNNSLSFRMRNDLVVDLDRALLCQDVDMRSQTDLASFPSLLSKSLVMLNEYLNNLLKCYEDALEVLKEG